MMNNLVYSETQRVRMWWVYAVCILIAGLASWMFVLQIMLNTPVGTHPAPDWTLYVILGLSVILVVLVFMTRLLVRVDRKGVLVLFSPFLRKHYPWSKISSYEVLEYDPVKDFGGWGIRHNWKQKSKAFTVSGHHGLSLLLTDGRKVIIGTYKPEKLKLFLSQQSFKQL